jgi:hypothetical protein
LGDTGFAGGDADPDSAVTDAAATDAAAIDSGPLDMGSSDVPQGPGGGPGAEPYDLSVYADSIDAVFGGTPPRWPTPPTSGATTMISTDSCSTLQDAVTPGGSLSGARRIVLDALVTDCTVSVTENDIWLEMTNTASVSSFGSFSISSDRVKVTGGAITTAGNSQLAISGDDVLIDNVVMVLGNDVNATSGSGVILYGSTRVAITNSSIASMRYAIFTDAPVSDTIVANTNLMGALGNNSQSTFRIMRRSRTIIADNRFTNGLGSTLLRLWKGAENVLVAGNHFMDTDNGLGLWVGGTNGQCGDVDNMLITSNKFYADGGASSSTDMSLASSCTPQNTCVGITVADNTVYQEPDLTAFTIGSSREACTIVNEATLTADNNVGGDEDFSNNFPGGFPSVADLGIGPDH